MNKNNIFWLAFVSLLLIPQIAFAGDAANMIYEVQTTFRDLVRQWYPPLQDAARFLLLSLAAISLVWSAGMMFLGGNAGFETLLALLVRFVMTTGFFLWMIQEAENLTKVFLNGWVWLGNAANGGNLSVGIPQIFERGLDLSMKIYDGASILDPSTFLLMIVLAFVVFIVYIFIAIHALFIMLEMYVVAAASVVLLGFGGNQWTGQYAMSFFRYLISIGIKVFVMFLVLGAGEKLINDWSTRVDLSEIPSVFVLIGIVLTIAYLVRKIPDVAQAMISGQSISANSSPWQTMTNATKTAGAAVAGGVAGAAGMAYAASEGVKQAKEEGITGAFNVGARATEHMASAAKGTVGGMLRGDYNANNGTIGGTMVQAMRSGGMSGAGMAGAASGVSSAAADTTHTGGAPLDTSSGASGANQNEQGSAAPKVDERGKDDQGNPLPPEQVYNSPAIDLTKK